MSSRNALCDVPSPAFMGNGEERFGHFKNPETLERTLPNGNHVDANGWEHYYGYPELPVNLRRWRDR